MKQIASDQNNSEMSLRFIPLVICPHCMNNFPCLQLKPLNGQMYLNVECLCSKKLQVVSLRLFLQTLKLSQKESSQCLTHKEKAKKYCTQCKAYLCHECLSSHLQLESDHELSNHELKIECSVHRKIFSLFCRQCQVNCCPDCKRTHYHHRPFALRFLEYEKPNDNFFEQVNRKNRELTNKLIKRIDEKNQNHLKQMREAIQSACDVNESINIDLEQLYLSLCLTVSTFQASPSYELMKLQQIIINTHQYVEEQEESIPKDYVKLMNHLQKNYVLKQAINECVTTLRGLNFRISSLIQLHNGNLAAGCYDGIIQIWSSSINCKYIATLKGHTGGVTDLIQLIDGRLASCSEDSTILLWNGTTYKNIAIIQAHDGWIASLLQLSDSTLVSCSYEYVANLKLWNATNNTLIAILTGHTNAVSCVCQCNDGRLASGSHDHSIKLWDRTTNQCEATLQGHTGYLKCLLQLKDGRLASGSFDTTIKLWDLKTNDCIFTLKGRDSVGCIIELNGGFIATGSHDNHIHLWSLATNTLSATVRGHVEAVVSLVQLNDGRLASGSFDQTIKIWAFTPF